MIFKLDFLFMGACTIFLAFVCMETSNLEPVLHK